MKSYPLHLLLTGTFAFAASHPPCWAAREREVTVQRIARQDASPDFQFSRIPSPIKNDAGAGASIAIVDGAIDPNSGGLKCLNDGRAPGEEDEPQSNFFFRAGSQGGRVLFDLKRVIPLVEVRSYSWHPGSRAPQNYSIYTAEGTEPNFEASPKRGVDPVRAGWHFLAEIGTNSNEEEPGGQTAVQIKPPFGTDVACRYLLFDISPTRLNDPFAHTFFSEIDVIDASARDEPEAIATAKAAAETFTTRDSAYTFVLDVSETPELADWARTRIIPMAREWYPKIVELFPSDGYKAPSKVTILFKAGMAGVANTSGTRIQCAGRWFRDNMEGEAVGAVFHELVHVVQQYGRTRRGAQAPGWLVEGLADYTRWFVYEPQTKGAEITTRNISRAHYDASYRITANFLNWVSQKHTQDVASKLNAAIREGRYKKELWEEITGKALEDLGSDWRAAMEKKIKADSAGE